MARASKGFSLVEVTVAIAIIGTMIVATGFLLERLPVSGREVRDQDLALKIARDEVEALRALGYDALPSSGSFSNALLSSLAEATTSLSISDAATNVTQAAVSVSWRGAGAATRTVTLTTLIAKNSGLP